MSLSTTLATGAGVASRTIGTPREGIARVPTAGTPSSEGALEYPATARSGRSESAIRAGEDAIKRLFDVVVALTALALLLPLWIAIAVLVKYETPGPVFYVHTRVGRGGRPFRMFKFRSMVQNAEHLRAALEQHNEMKGGILFKMQRDPRVTRLGQVLRRSSLDETPQLINVLLGHMSIVGPRPPLPAEVAKYSPAQRLRLQAKPGLTCLWQVSGRSLLDFDQQVRLDVQYIQQRSLWLDLWIVLRTIPAVFAAKGAF
jgi:lipopolysaccharide/colanic/teichoic acid biosynthesis glycosyltransferase